MVDVLNLSQDEIFDVARLAEFRRTTKMTAWNWMIKGARAVDGSRIRLRSIKLGGKRVTTKAWIDEHLNKLAEVDERHFAAKTGGTGLQTPTVAKVGRRRLSPVKGFRGAKQSHRQATKHLIESGLVA